MAFRSIKLNITPTDKSLPSPFNSLSRLSFQGPIKLGKLTRNGGHYILTNTVQDFHAARFMVLGPCTHWWTTPISHLSWSADCPTGNRIASSRPSVGTTRGIVDARYIVTRQGETSTLLRLTFMGPVPNDLQKVLTIITGRRPRVEPFNHHPIRCHRCHGFHQSKGCKATPICGKCSGAHTTAQCAVRDPKCPNCKGPHDAYSSECAYHKLHSYATLQHRLPGGPSYAQALRMGRTLIPILPTTTPPPPPNPIRPSPGRVLHPSLRMFCRPSCQTRRPKWPKSFRHRRPGILKFRCLPAPPPNRTPPLHRLQHP